MGNSNFEEAAKNLGSAFASDAEALKACAQWRIARAEQLKIWAEGDLVSLFGKIDGPEMYVVNIEPLHRMEQLQEFLAEIKPHTVALASEMLRVAISILAYEGGADDFLGQGPVLALIRNVVDSLDYCAAETEIGSGLPGKRPRPDTKRYAATS